MDENTVAVGKDIDLETVILQNVDLAESIGAFREVAEQFQQLMMMYSCAIREVRTKLEVLNDEFQVQRSHNPISYIKYRVKKPASILEKLKRRGYPVTLQSVEDNPVFFSDGCKLLKVEVQIRTIAMDFWASLEHQLKYKTEGDVPDEIAAELKDCSDVIANTDQRMQKIYNTLKTNKTENKQE